jgi:hypothetical protein
VNVLKKAATTQYLYKVFRFNSDFFTKKNLLIFDSFIVKNSLRKLCLLALILVCASSATGVRHLHLLIQHVSHLMTTDIHFIKLHGV